MTNATSPDHSQKKRFSKKTIIGVTILLVFAVCLAAWQVTRSKVGNDTTAASSRIIAKVGTHYVLPSGETPTVAQIQNKDSLQSHQEFYQGAENGDYLLVYAQSKIAILYRESLNKLIKVSPVSMQTEQNSDKQ
jgi:hypothetical protein